MAPKTFLGSDGTPQLSENEQRFVKALFKAMTTVPEADWEKCAQDLGLKDSKCAKERWRQISTKRGWSRHTKRGSDSIPTTTSSTEPATPPREPVRKATGSRVTSLKPEEDEPAPSKPAVLRRVASGGVKKEAKVKRENITKMEDEVKDEAGAYEERSQDSKFFAKKGTFLKGEPTVKSEPTDVDETIPTASHTLRKRKHGNEKLIIDLEEDLEDFRTTTESKSTVPNTADDNRHIGHSGAHIPFGHPSHCMSF